MRVIIAGGSGFLGSALTRALRGSGHEVLVLARRVRGAGQVAWNPDDTSGEWVARIDGADAVINLAGERLDQGRWTAHRKSQLLNSRVVSTRALVSAIATASRPPGVFISASAVGYYGPHGDEVLDESSKPGADFLAAICVAWEREARLAAPRSRVVLLRTGLVLSRDGGALPPMSLAFRLFVGGRVGSGNQWWSWIHIDDWVRLVEWMLGALSADGPVNLTAPEPVTNREFAARLGSALGRPSLVPVPGFALRLLVGEMADAAILSGQRVMPQRALAGGFQFRFPRLDAALADLYRGSG